MRRADVAADAALDAGVEAVAVGEAEVVVLGGVEQAGGVDADGAALDAPAAADAGVGVHVRLARAGVDAQLPAGDHAVRGQADLPQRAAAAQVQVCGGEI